MKFLTTLAIALMIAINSYCQPAGPTDSLMKPEEGIKALPGDYAVVAGGSKGIGYAIAEALARRNFNLVLIARHTDSLHAAMNRLEERYHVHVEILPYDLSKETAADDIAHWCTERNIHLKMLCNVAGFGGSRDFMKLPEDTLRYMIRLNIESAVTLTWALLPLLQKNAPSYVLNVGSMAGLAPLPAKNLYAATKSAVIFFSYSMRHQLKPMGISVSCLCPGPVFTKPEIERETKRRLGWLGVQMAVPPERVGEIAVRKTLRRRMIIVPGTLAGISSGFLRVAPRGWVAGLLGKSGNK